MSRAYAFVCLCWDMCACVSVYASEPRSMPEEVHVCRYACVCVASLKSKCAQLEDEGVWARAYPEERNCQLPAAEMQMFWKSQRPFHTARGDRTLATVTGCASQLFPCFTEWLECLLPTRQVLFSGQKLGSQMVLANILS